MDGHAVAAVRALGADLAYAGTRFIASQESLAVEDYKQMIVEGNVGDLICTRAFTGADANMLRPSIRRAGLDPDALEEAGRKPDFSSEGRKNRAWKNIWSAGQGIGAVRSIDSVPDIVSSYDTDYRAAMAHVGDCAVQPNALSAAE
jgi:nitronate monooxygenase